MAETKEKVAPVAESFANLSSEQFVTALMGQMTPKAEDKTPNAAKAEPSTSQEKAVETPVAEKPKTEEAKADEKPKDVVVVEGKVSDDKKTATVEAKDDKKTETTKVDENAAPTMEFKLPDAKKDGETITPESNGWKELAKEFEIEINEDKFEEFKEKLDTHFKNKYEINLGKYNAETQAVIEALEGGMTIEEYIKPTEGIDRLIGLDDVAIVTADLKARKFPDDKIEKEIARLTEVDQLDLYAINVREALENKKVEIQSKIIASKTNAAKRQDTYKTNTSTEQSASIKKALNTVSDFMETPLKADVKEFITQKEQKGEYANLFNDPKVKAEFLLWYEFGKAATTNLKQKAYHEALMKYKADRHNIPPIDNAGGTGVRSTSQTAQKAEGNWTALEGFDPMQTFGKR